MKRFRWLLVLMAVCGLLLAATQAAPGPEETARRATAQKLMRDGNWQEAYTEFSAFATDRETDPQQVANDLSQAVHCLQRLGRIDEFDEFIEKSIAAHEENWRLLHRAAQLYMDAQHRGVIIAGKFVRGPHRGGTGKRVNSFERDRVRSLQLLEEALPLVAENKSAKAEVTWQLAQTLLANRGYSEAWRLQYLTDIKTLPDYEEGYYGWYGRSSRGAPVHPDGTPVFHALAETWNDAKTDGERWRWALQYDAERRKATLRHFADFHHNQFGVQTMAQDRWFWRGSQPEDGSRENESGTYALHTLKETETIARLANGIKRFSLPDEFNFVLMYKELAETEILAQIFENRRQYPRAADYWRTTIARNGPGHDNYRQKRLDQIIQNWGMFEPVMTQPAGQGATVEFRFRNGKKVNFVAYEIDIEKLLADVKDYLKSSPPKLNWEQINISDLGYRLVRKNQRQYVGNKVAEWSLDLDPLPNHFDRRITVTTPLQKAGAYLVTADMDAGNTTNIVLWVADTAIVQKPLEGKPYYFVADAVTGKPIPKANLEFFGYRQERVEDAVGRGVRYRVLTENFAEQTDNDGQLFTRTLDRQYQWVIVARTPEGRLAYLGFSHIWSGRYREAEYNQRKTFLITDRPVYRPGHDVKFKFWVNHAKYDQEGKSSFAGRSFKVIAKNPRNETVFEKSFVADEFGGINGEFTLGKEATLGNYQLYIEHFGGGSFRVEEYKKPEFEVTVDAPSEPVMLGEKTTAKISANYYFGAPVTEAKVKYKVLRSEHSADWYPIGLWDWFYEPGYWWFAYDYTWYPGWREWGCPRPVPFWWGWRPQPQPELVAEVEVPIGEDGTVNVEIDTAIAKELMGDVDHRYQITAEVTDLSRRTIVGQGAVLVARKPFKVFAWVNRGHYRVGDTIHANFKAHTLAGKPVEGKGLLRLLRISYDENKQPVETEVQQWDLDTNDEGRSHIQMTAARAGQYRLSYQVTDAKDHTIEGGYVFVIRGAGFDGSAFRFNAIELVTDKREYQPGETVNLMINTEQPDSTVVLFVRPSNGVYLPPKILRLRGKSTVEDIAVVKKDMPNFFVEAFTVANGKVYSETREVIVPPESRVLDVEVTPSAKEFKPGEKATVQVKLTGPDGKPFVGSTVVSIYDKAVEYISGGSNVQEIKSFFWKWRRRHNPRTQSSLDKGGHNVIREGLIAMGFIGVFGHSVADEEGALREEKDMVAANGGRALALRAKGEAREGLAMDAVHAMPSAAPPMEEAALGGEAGGGETVEPQVRTQFADTALWVGSLTTDVEGRAEVSLTMPDNLTTWKTRVWAMGGGTRCGEGTAEIVTTKNLIVRLQAPRFFVQKDEVVLSANVHNYLEDKKTVQVILELEGETLELAEGTEKQSIEVDANGEKRVNWRVKVLTPGEAVIRVKALTDEESDAMEMRYPVYVHGMLKTDSFSGVIRPEQDRAAVTMRVPAERKPEQSVLEIRYSPTLAGAMVDALPYLADYPYGCTEQTLNRFLPAVITQKVLLDMGLDLKDIQEKRTNLNAQEIGDDAERAKQWKRFERNPVFDDALLRDMVKAGVERLTSMQCSDGGWGWFSGWGEQSYPHTTAVVVHGLQVARENDVAILPNVLERGVEWLKRYQAEELRELKNAATKTRPWKNHADNIDAMVYMVLVDAGSDNLEMRDFLYRDRNELAVYAKAMFGIALHKVEDFEKRDMLIRNIEQFLVNDDENQTAYLRLNEGWRWYWYGSEYEAQAYYLKLLCVTDPKGETASRLVKYLVNNRKHATYWNSTRDTAVCVEAFADFLRASGEDKPDMTLTVLVDDKPVKEVKIDASNLFTFDNKVILSGEEVTTGEHTVELRREGTGPVYFNAYLTNFTLEDPISKAGLEIKVERKVYKLVRVDKTIKVEGVRGQALDQKVEKYKRILIPGPFEEIDRLPPRIESGDLLEVELEIESKNDYEYLIFEDMKPAGCEPVEVRSGYNGNDLRAYVEFRDERTVFFCRRLARGKHSVSYRLRAEIPGFFSALPAKGNGMYAPELRANSNEHKLTIVDAE